MKFAKMKTVFLALLFCSGFAITAVAADAAFSSGPEGLRYKDLQSGRGAPAAAGQVATIHFVGWIDEQGVRGREFFNSRKQRGEPVSFLIGTERVMPAWNHGVIGMKPGGSRMLLIPPGLAYGNRAVDGLVPANASLLMRVDLIDVKELPAN